MKRLLLPAILLFFIIVIFFSIQTPIPPLKKQLPHMGDYKFENVTISLLKKGKKEWVLNAEVSSYYKDSQTIYFEELDGNYYLDGKGKAVSFKSPIGTFDFTKGNLKMIESKSKLSIDNNEYYIHSDELELLTEKSLLYAYGNINITSDTLMLNAQKMIGNFKENKIYLTYDIEGAFINTSN